MTLHDPFPPLPQVEALSVDDIVDFPRRVARIMELGLGVFVAADDTPEQQRRLAQFKCDGVDDEEEFAAAQAVIDASGVPGVIRALPGGYSFGAKFTLGANERTILVANGAIFAYQGAYRGTLLEFDSAGLLNGLQGGDWNTASLTSTAPVIDVAGDRSLISGIQAKNNHGPSSSVALRIQMSQVKNVVLGSVLEDVEIEGLDNKLVGCSTADLTLTANSQRNLLAAVTVDTAIGAVFTDNGTNNQVAAVHGATNWKTWTPTYTNLNVGSTGTTEARYAQTGKHVEFYWEATLGGTGISVGDVRVSLPVAAASHYAALSSPFGVATLFESGVANYSANCLFASTTTFGVRYWDTATSPSIRSQVLTSTVPFTWGAADKLIAIGSYEAA